MMTIKEQFTSKALDPRFADRDLVLFEDERYTWRQTYDEAVRYANAFLALRHRSDIPLHVGMLMENYPEFVFAFLGCALSGGVVVGINTTQRGSALARDINHCDCQVLITEKKFLDEVMGIRKELQFVGDGQILVNNRREADKTLPKGLVSLEDRLAELERKAGPAFRKEPDVTVKPEDWMMIIFTSGSTGAPKGIMNSHKKFIETGGMLADRLNYGEDDVSYAAMPLFHSNSTVLALVPAVVKGAKISMPRRFSARGFLPDVRKFGVTSFNYVGKPLAYILATHEKPDDANNPLRTAIGNGASAEQQEEFQRRFGLYEVAEVFGSTEGGATTVRALGDPRGSVGVMPPELKILNEKGEECPPAEVDRNGRILNYDAAVGEITNVSGPGRFEEYYKNPAATAAKIAGNMFHTGDLAYYRMFEKDGVPTRFMYFVGRTSDWIRKDGENFLADPLEEIVGRWDDVFLSSVYGVPCADGDELVMAALVMREGRAFDPKKFYDFLRAQGDMSEKWLPDFIRVTDSLPQTDTVKILRRALKKDYFNYGRIADPMYWRERGDTTFKPFTEADYQKVLAAFVQAGRSDLLI
jgi:fatty-acyl-CoA synthase